MKGIMRRLDSNGERMTAFYTLADCARLLRKPKETVRDWTLKGLAPARAIWRNEVPSYGFTDLVSLFVVSELRARGIPLQRIRKAEEWLRNDGGLARPLATRQLYTAGKDILIRAGLQDGNTPLIAASRGGQQAIEQAFESVLQAVEYDRDAAIRWKPWASVDVDPRRQFGAPCVTGTGIQTSMLHKLVMAGDDPEYVARMYSLPLKRVVDAVSWEEKLSKAA
jgi:uncharacterized protein (DUF433 family)